MGGNNDKKRIRIHIEIMHQSDLNNKKLHIIPITQSSSYILGRSKKMADIILNDPGVSGTHLEISFTNNQLWIRDLNTKNGTRVNALNILRKNLERGDMITIGMHILTIKRIERIFEIDTPTHLFLLGGQLEEQKKDSTISQIVSRLIS